MTDFAVKSSHLLTSPTHGYDALHDDGKRMLAWLCDLCKERGWIVPTVTCFGRTRDDQQRIYFGEMFAKATKVVENGAAVKTAQRMARDKWSWHCLALPDKKCRAFDIRIQVAQGDKVLRLYPGPVLSEIVRLAKENFPGCEALVHTVTAPHLHLAFPSPAGRPDAWL